MNDKLFDLSGRVIIVTGFSRGIGFAISKALVSRGAQVIGLSRRLPDESLDVEHYECDLKDTNSLCLIIDSVFKKYKRIDGLVNCAGVTFSLASDFEERLSRFNETLAINLTASYVLMEKVSERMKEFSSGSIVNVTSIAAEFGFPGNPSYVGSKGGLKQMSKAFAVDLGTSGVRVNCICPGYIHTDMTNASFNDQVKNKERMDNMVLPRWGKPEDLIGAAVFLLSDASSYVTGADIVVDGGWCSKGMK